MGKEEKELDFDTLTNRCSKIAHPLVPKKLYKKVLKVVKKASKDKQVKRGVKEVVKGLRKGTKGVVVIAGDVFPIDVVSHLPVLCEEASVPYIYVPSKDELGHAGSTKQPTSVLLILESKDAEYKDGYEEVVKEVVELNERM